MTYVLVYNIGQSWIISLFELFGGFDDTCDLTVKEKHIYYERLVK